MFASWLAQRFADDLGISAAVHAVDHEADRLAPTKQSECFPAWGTQEFVRLVAHYNAERTARLQPNRNITAKFMLLHTLAHVLINQLSFDCGYGSASLRERLYCDFTDPSRPMHGFLIYTASGDSEGTMPKTF
jgi:hypothetical protein